MKKSLYKFAFAALALASFNACSLDEYNPSQKTADDVWSTFEGFKGLQSYCYQSLYGQLFSAYDYLSVAEGGTDCWLTPGGNPDYAKQVIYYDGLATNTNATNKLFGQAYSMIGNCNTVVNRAESVKDGNAEDITTLVAEARCLRAYYYSILVTYYGNVALNLEESSQKPITAPQRSTIPALYAQMIADLKFAANNLKTTPYDNNRARVTKKTALGLLARIYAQGAGEYPELNLQDEGVPYWECARKTAEDLINNMSAYGAGMYDDVEDTWAQANNMNNKEALFIACGPNPLNEQTFKVGGNQSNLHTYVFPKPGNLSGIYPTPDKAMFAYGRTNNNTFAPSKYLLDCFDAKYDKRWEVTFTTAFAQMSGVQDGGAYEVKNKNYSEHLNQKGHSIVEITPEIQQEYGLDPSFIQKKIYPYFDLKAYWTDATWTTQITSVKIWPKGEHSGDPSKLVEVKNPLVVPYPLAEDEDRFCIYLSKDKLTDAEKAKRIYYCLNIDDLFQPRGEGWEYRTSNIKVANDFKMYPGLNKYTWMFDGSRTTNLQKFTGDIYVMRMAEVYLLAAEANVALGDGGKAAEHLNVLRKRACRNASDYEQHMKLSTADIDDVFDEYARELCGEYQRWPLMKRHKDSFLARLKKGNPRAAENFDAKKHFLRPISFNYLSQIDNPDEFGNNGY